ncbi:MAG: hypothetical protein ABR971_01140, partial [Acidobacteriaceae bacterium]
MKKTNDTRLPKEHPTMAHRVAGAIGVALLVLTGFAAAQGTPATPAAPATPATASVALPAGKTVQDGFFVHQTVDLGGHILALSGSGSMYDTLVNIQSGPRVLGQTITLRSIPGVKQPLLDSLTGYSNGFGGDPINVVKLDFSKGKVYEFSGTFRRDRQYFDYDLFGNPNIPGGQSIPIGPNGSLGKYAWPQVLQSPELFNTVRRMTDTNLTIFPLSKFTFRVGYSQNIFQGPRSIPGAYETAKTDMLFQEMERNSTDEFLGAIDWKPLQQTIVTLEEVVTHYKNDSYFILNPNQYTVQEANGLPVSLGNWDSQTPYAASNCNANSIATAGVILTSASGSAGLPVVDPACSVISKYTRYQPTRTLTPTEMVRFQSSSIRNLAANGIFRYTDANSSMPNYQENFQGLNGIIRTQSYTGSGIARRQNVGIDFGATYQLTSKFSFSDQFDFSNVRIPGTGTFSGVSESTPATAHNETINYAGPLTPGVVAIVGQAPNGLPLPNYLGTRILNNNVTATWDVTPRAMVSLTYRYGTRFIGQKVAAYAGTPSVLTFPVTNVNIETNGGIVNIALRPTANWNVNGTFEAYYADNAFTPVGARQTQIYRVHSSYKPKTWASFATSYLDTEHHNNTNNTGVPSIDGPLQHVDHSRVFGLSADLAPSEKYSFDFNYGYSDVYTSTNICYLNGATPTLPGTAVLTPSGVPAICPGVFVRGSTTVLSSWGPTKDFADAPTQYASASLTLNPTKTIQSNLGYTISAVSGNQFFNDARQVNGSLQSAWQSPFVHVAWTAHPGWIFRADYNYYGYGEGGPSGAPLCSTTTSPTTVVVPCNSPTLAGFPTGLTEPPSGLTAPRNFHANLV